jgi:precorrin-3B C17-methyltransferase
MRSNRAAERAEQRVNHNETEDRRRDAGRRPGRLSIVSLGPGERSFLVPQALEALLAAEVIVGYKTYLALISDLLEGREIFASGMRKELERCQAAIDYALQGRRVAIVSSGDAGIYGMAGLIFDLCHEQNLHLSSPTIETDETFAFSVEVIPGVAALNAAASLVGAPLMHDFAAISLSDHLTPWEVITKRIVAAASADFVLALYNPRSKTRPHLLEKAQQMLLEHRAPETPVAIVRSARRAGEWKHLTTLANIPLEEVDMQSILLVGNSRTYIWDGWMITPRGYLQKYSVRSADR